MENVEERLIHILSTLLNEDIKEQLKQNEQLQNNLYIQFVVEVEKEFDIEYPDDMNLCQYFGHRKLNFFSPYRIIRNRLLCYKSLIFNLLWSFIIQCTLPHNWEEEESKGRNPIL